MITDQIAVAMLALLGVLLAALIAGMVSVLQQLVRWRAENHRLWLWNRELVDHIYRGKPPPPPTAPAELFD